MTDWTLRRIASHEGAIVARHRVRMFEDMGQVPAGLTEALEQSSERALSALLASGDYLGWFGVASSGEVIAGAGVHIKPQLPRIALSGDTVADGPVPLVVNVFTEPQWRGRGIARGLMRHLMGWAQDEGYERVVLHASDAARPIYVSLGFKATNEMRWAPHPDT